MPACALHLLVGTILVIGTMLMIAAPARAVMDINDRGPMLTAGNFALRVTNVGTIGNAFFDQGLSFDPSFEYPRGSGNECLKHADLWVGALDDQGHEHVSGGPLLEWRPTLAPDDRVRIGWRGQSGSRRGVDDDGDGRMDEEIFNGKDDDGDGEVDEDLGFPSDEVAASDYVDDRPEAVNYGYPNGETHVPFGLSVHEEEYAWALPGYDSVVGIQYTITNHSTRVLRQLYVGLLADLDSRRRNEPGGAVNDMVVYRTFRRVVPEGFSNLQVHGVDATQPATPGACRAVLQREVPVVVNAIPGGGLPAVAVVAMEHTTDPLAKALFANRPDIQAWARAPGGDTFRFSVFRNDLPARQGGVPVLDAERYEALQGQFPTAPRGYTGDPVILVSCGPFVALGPHESIQVAFAFVAGADADSLTTLMGNAAFLHHGVERNFLRDSLDGPQEWDHGATGLAGHEVCLEPPPGLSFDIDPHCAGKFFALALNPVPEEPAHFEHGHCVWTDADCDGCTGKFGNETVVRWLDPGSVPPSPAYRSRPGHHDVTIEWDNQPEVLLNAGQIAGGFTFWGYRVYRVSDWRGRASAVPGMDLWEQIAGFSRDTLNQQIALAACTDSSVGYDLIRYGQLHYPVGRYRYVDRRVLDGFDYVYVVTTVAEHRITVGLDTLIERTESPVVASIDSMVSPHVQSRAAAGQAWVVPNPYRAHAEWDRPPVPGDPFGRHIDFMGLPKARSTIRIWTLAGDMVAQIEHDGRNGDGQAGWNLISRNGQDVVSGVYLFTVDSSLGRQVGRFVVIR